MFPYYNQPVYEAFERCVTLPIKNVTDRTWNYKMAKT